MNKELTREHLDQIILYYNKSKSGYLISFLNQVLSKELSNTEKIEEILLDSKYQEKEYLQGWINLSINLLSNNYNLIKNIPNKYLDLLEPHFNLIFSHADYKEIEKKFLEYKNPRFIEINKEYKSSASKTFNETDFLSQLKKAKNFNDLAFIIKTIKENPNSEKLKEILKEQIGSEKQYLFSSVDSSGKMVTLYDFCNIDLSIIEKNIIKYYSNNFYLSRNLINIFDSSNISFFNKLETYYESKNKGDFYNLFGKILNLNLETPEKQVKNKYGYTSTVGYSILNKQKKVASSIMSLINSQQNSVKPFEFLCEKMKTCITQNNCDFNLPSEDKNGILWVLNFISSNQTLFDHDKKFMLSFAKLEKKYINRNLKDVFKEVPLKQKVINKL